MQTTRYFRILFFGLKLIISGTLAYISISLLFNETKNWAVMKSWIQFLKKMQWKFFFFKIFFCNIALFIRSFELSLPLYIKHESTKIRCVLNLVKAVVCSWGKSYCNDRRMGFIIVWITYKYFLANCQHLLQFCYQFSLLKNLQYRGLQGVSNPLEFIM